MLKALCKEEIFRLNPCFVIVGMALGMDTAAAEACLELDIPYVATVPFTGQEKLWPEESQRIYHELLSKAYRVEVLSSGEQYSAKLLLDRNSYMIDRADHVLALWDGKHKGGTADAIRKARARGLDITNVWERFSVFAGLLDVSKGV
jgi:uncharacterized phage-like protein YoqJ